MSKGSYYDADAYLPGVEDDDSLENQPLVANQGSASHPHAVKLTQERPVPAVEQAALAAYWFGWSFLWLPLLVVVIPLQIMRLARDEDKGAAMGTALLLGSFVSLFAAPVFGSLSDTSTHPLGRRRPFMIVGAVIASIALFIMAIAPSLGWFSFAFFLLSLANNMIMAPYSALVPDMIPPTQRGTASGWLGGLSMLGYLAGGLLTYHIADTGLFGAYMILIFVHGAALSVTVYTIQEEPLVLTAPPPTPSERLASFMAPLQSNDFRVVFFTRFLMQMGILTVQEYLQFYLKDAIGPNFVISGTVVADSPEKAVSLLFLPVLLGAFVSSLAAGFISDLSGGRRKAIVYAAGGTMSVTCVLFAFTRSYAFDMLIGLAFGLGFGAFSVMDWALATDVLPSKDDYAKDMGIWSLALVLPQVIAAPIAGYMLDYFQSVGPSINLGYTVIFLLSVVYFAAGTFFVKHIESVE
jgi:MFS family permease